MIRVKRKEFLEELQFLAIACEKRVTIPILATVKIETAGERANLSTSDLDLTALTSLAIKGEGAFCLPFFDLLNAVRNSSGEFVELTQNPTRVQIVCGRGKFSIPFFSIENFPAEPEFKPENELEISGASLSEFLRLAAFAGAAKDYDQNKQNLFIRNNGKLTGFAWNGASASIVETSSPVETELNFSVPLTSVPAIRQVCDSSDTVTLRIGGRHVGVSGGVRSLITREMTAKPPQYETLRKPDESHSAVIISSELNAAIKASQSLDDLVTQQDGRFASLLFQYENESLIKVSAEKSEVAFEGDFVAEQAQEFAGFKINTALLQKLCIAVGKDARIRFVFSKDRTVAFADVDDFKVEFLQANLTF